jgi:hypothetical protein
MPEIGILKVIWEKGIKKWKAWNMKYQALYCPVSCSIACGSLLGNIALI